VSNAGSPRSRLAVATVCLPGTLDEKLAAAAEAGFDGVELFEPDLVDSRLAPAEIRVRCAELGLRIEAYQPIRDLDSTDPARAEANLRRADRTFDLIEDLGADTVLMCSSVAPDAVTDDGLLAAQLHALAGRAGERGLRIAYEALARARHVRTYPHSWDVVRRADHPALGLCLDSFHILSSGSDPAAIADIPAEKLFFLQLADAPTQAADVLRWSRHHRLFPGQGTYDLPDFVRTVLAAGYRGPLSAEVFNVVFQPSDPVRTAVDARRSLLALAESTAAIAPLACADPVAAPPPALTGFAFVELAVPARHADVAAATLSALGFTRTGRHPTAEVDRWEQGTARLLVNSAGDREVAAISALAVESADPAAAARRAERLLATRLPISHGETDQTAVAAPDGTSLLFCRAEAPNGTGEFTATGEVAGRGIGITGIDHLGLTQPFDHFDEAALFYRSVLGLQLAEIDGPAAPFGVVRSNAITDAEHRVRLALTVASLPQGEWAPAAADPQYVALATDDVVASALAARSAGAALLDPPDNYYTYLAARYGLADEVLAGYRAARVLYSAAGDDGSAYLQVCTELLGGHLFIALVQRIGGADGYGWADAPVRLAAHRHRR
jgi:3-dehydroshikimate dehydratase